MARMGKVRKTKRQPRKALAARDYQWPGEKQYYLYAVVGVWVMFLAAAAYCAWQAFRPDLGQMLHNRHQVWIILLLYPAISISGLNYLAARPRKMELKKAGTKAKVMATNHAEMHKVIQDASRILSLKKAPDAYIIEDNLPTLYAVPGGAGSLMISKKVFEVLKPEEVVAAVAKQLGHIKSGHVRVELALTTFRSLNPFLKIVVIPVAIWSFILKDWLDHIDYTADRCSLLVVRRLGTCTASMVKLAAGASRVTEVKDAKSRRKRRQRKTEDEEADAAIESEKMLTDISPEELDAYLAGSSDDDVMGDPGQVERSIKVSRFIDQQRNLRQRIRNLSEWVDTDQCDAALEKVDEIRQQLK